MKIIQIFIWSITVTLAFVYAAIFQWTINPPRVEVQTRFMPQNPNKVEMESESEELIVEKDFENECEGRCKLVWKNDDGSEITLSQTKHGSDFLGVSRIQFYKEGDKSFLIFFKNAAEDSGAPYEADHYQIMLFDTKAREQKVLFDPQKPVNGVVPDYSFYPDGLKLIGSEVYFSFTSARGIEDGYYIDLEDKELQVQKLSQTKGPVITKWNRYWVVGHEYGEGHGQFGNASYTPINLDTKKLGQKIIGFGGEVGSFSDLLGVTKDGQVIRLESFTAVMDPEVFAYTKTLTKVWIHPLNNESSSSTLFAEDMIPQGVTEAFFNTNKNSLFFLGEKLFEYNFDSKKMTETIVPEALSGFILGKLLEDERVCFITKTRTGISSPSKIWDIEKASISEPIGTSCWIWEANQFPATTPRELQVVEV